MHIRGGGRYEEKYFYDSCKELTHSSCKFQGIMLVTVKAYISNYLVIL